MSFYTALTGLNGSSADISATSNNIANVGTTGFKRSRVEFGDIFATSPLQNASSSIGSGTILKGIKQQFTQGNIASSLNALDLAISGQGYFALKPSLTASQTVYTRNGSLNVNNDRYVVDSFSCICDVFHGVTSNCDVFQNTVLGVSQFCIAVAPVCRRSCFQCCE